MNNQAGLELGITDDTVERILSSLGPLPSIDRAKISEIAQRLRALYAVAYVEHQRSPRNIRSTLDKALNPLLKDIRSLQRRLIDQNLEPLNLPLRASALDLFIKDSANDPAERGSKNVRYIAPLDVVQRIEQPLRELESLVHHLCNLVDDFDKLDLTGQSGWFFGGPTERDRNVRQMVYPYFRKRGGVGADTYVVRHIAELYKYVFGKSFKINPLTGKPKYQKQRASKRRTGLPRYSGKAITFASAVIKELKLEGLMVPVTLSDLSPNGSLKPHSNGDVENQYDLSEWNRARALQGDPVSDASLVNKVGDIWTNDSRRQGEKSLHS